MGRTCWLGLIVSFGVGAWVGASWLERPSVHAQAETEKQLPDLAALAADVTALKSREVDQAHAMVDVTYHFSNLWFAAQKRNWSLADFYLSETKSKLRWAVRLKPIRKDAANQEIRLEAILEAVENSPLKDLDSAIKDKDSERFERAYRSTLEGCYSCHKASAKPYLRPAIPSRPSETVLRFDPDEESAK